MEVTGKIIAVCDIQRGTSRSGNEWKSQTFVLETDGDRPRKVAFELFGSKHDDFSAKCVMGAALTVSFDVESREYNGRWYTSIRAWRVVDAGEGGQSAAPKAEAPKAEASKAEAPKAEAPQAPAPEAGNGEGDLPF